MAFVLDDRNAEDTWPTIIKTEPLDNPDPDIPIEVGVKAKGFQCPTCQLIFKYWVHFKHHQTTNEICVVPVQRTQNQSPLQCNKINIKAPQAVTVPWKLTCPKCKKKFASRSGLGKHLRGVHTTEPHICSKCLFPFKYINDFKRHTKKEHTFKCNGCELSFVREVTRKQHKVKCHDLLVVGPQGKSFPCPECKKVFIYKTFLKRHMVVHSNNRPHVCLKCRMAFKLEFNLIAHTRRKHRFQCDDCGFAFLTKAVLVEHIPNCNLQVTNTSLSIKCEDQNSSLKVTSGCQPCSRSSWLKHRVRNPMGDDQGQEAYRYSCPECKKEFTYSRTLSNHMASVHSNERPFVCSICLLSFKLKANRDQHRRLEHKFKCENCELSFVQHRSLQEHTAKFHQRHAASSVPRS